MNTGPRKKCKNNLKKYFFKRMNAAVSKRTMENVPKQGDIKLVTTNARRNYLVSKLNYHARNTCFNIFIRNRNEKKTDAHD